MVDDWMEMIGEIKDKKEQTNQNPNLQHMKITMLGSSGSGKTAYMLGMFAEMQTGVGGFTITTDHDTENSLRNEWDTLVIGGDSRWPKATPSSTFYRFAFNYSYNPIMHFDWLDYRGGAMTEASTEEEVQVLLQHLQESDCIFLCIPGEFLETNQTTDTHQVAARAQTAKMNGLLRMVGERLKPTVKTPFPVVIMITKADLMGNTTFSMIGNLVNRSSLRTISEAVQNKITTFANKLFPTLFAPDSGWFTMICPVTLGKALAKDKKVGKIEPINISLPLIFAIQSKLLKIKYSIISEIEKEEQRKINNIGRETQPLDLNMSGTRIETASHSKLQEVEQYMHLLRKHLVECPIFLGGRSK